MLGHDHTSPLNRFIRDKNGNVVIAQTPNVPLIGWAVFGLLGFLVGKGTLHTGFQNLSRASLFTWAYLEISKGDNSFRRVLGVVIMIALIAGYSRS